MVCFDQRSVFGCAKYGMKALYRSEAGWPSFRLAVARSVTQYYARVMILKQDVVCGGGKGTRPVQVLMNEVLAKQLGRREEGVKEGTGIWYRQGDYCIAGTGASGEVG
jgi:hypothetical protein